MAGSFVKNLRASVTMTEASAQASSQDFLGAADFGESIASGLKAISKPQFQIRSKFNNFQLNWQLKNQEKIKNITHF
jgi:hypothetical protein